MSEPVLYHNPRCSKSRKALDLLREAGVDLRVVEYLNSPPDRADLDALRDALGLPPSEWIRRGEAAFGEAGLDDASLDAASDEAALLEAMAAHPILIERPILLVGKRAVVGRPPERVLELIRST